MPRTPCWPRDPTSPLPWDPPHASHPVLAKGPHLSPPVGPTPCLAPRAGQGTPPLPSRGTHPMPRTPCWPRDPTSPLPWDPPHSSHPVLAKGPHISPPVGPTPCLAPRAGQGTPHLPRETIPHMRSRDRYATNS